MAIGRRWLRVARERLTRPAVGRVEFGALRSVMPAGGQSADDSQSVSDYYAARFLGRYAGDYQGRTLIIGRDRAATGTTVVPHMDQTASFPAASFDCIVAQTLHLVYDVKSAVATLHHLLKPGGMLLATLPGFNYQSQNEDPPWYWAFTAQSARRLFSEAFPAEGVQVGYEGNVLTAVAQLHAVSADMLTDDELTYRDRQYALLIAVRAVKSADARLRAATPVTL
jgi:SAM-dependent methyltransferase